MTSATPPRSPVEPATLLVQRWSRCYLIALGGVAVLVALHQLVVQPMLLGLSIYPPKINLAGRQRMLSQKIVKEALALATLPAEESFAARRAQLLDDLQQWSRVHRQLSDAEGMVARDRNPIAAALRELDAPLDDVVSAATVLALEPDPDVQDRELQFLLEREARFLTGMEKVVALLERAAERELWWLRVSGLAIMGGVFVLLGGAYFLVLDPATRLIRLQFLKLSASEREQRQLTARLAQARDELEERVEERTQELRTANAALASEIEERKALEQRMQELGTQLAHAARITALGQLATGLAHEINQPLASIVTFADTAELLLDSPENQREALRGPLAQIKQSALRAGAIVRRMRSFVRRGSSQVARVDLNALVREVCDLCRPQLDQGRVQLSLDFEPGRLEVEVDPIEIQQVLVNVVQNAVQALAEKAPDDRRISISTSLVELEVRIEIADNGPGFAAANIEDSLAPFFTTKADGLGMGLAISRSLLERYRGELRAENRSEGGARVVLTIPLLAWHEVETGVPAHSLCR